MRGIVEDDKFVSYIESVFRYILRNVNIQQISIIENIWNISEKGENVAMSTAQKLENQGLQQGRRQYLEELVTAFYFEGRLFIGQIVKVLRIEDRYVVKLVNKQKKNK